MLVVIGILAALVALLFPALSGGRSVAKRTQCLNNLRQVGLAMIQVADRKGRFPASGTFSATGPEQYFSWVVPLLRDLDRNDLANAWDLDQPADDVTPPTSGTANNGSLAQTGINILVCPLDTTIVPGRGNLSYAVNGGFGWTQPVDCPTTPHWAGVPSFSTTPFDFNGDGKTCNSAEDDPALLGSDRLLYFRTGLFFAENWPEGTGTSRHHTLGSITDGASTTIMIAENVRVGFDPAWNSSWASPWPPRQSFFLSGYICKSSSCSAGNVDYARANDRSGLPQSLESINASLDQAEGEAPWPSSYHPGGVNVVMADGHGQFLRETIDGKVYAALVSPQGLKIKGPLGQVIPGEDDY